MNGTDILKQYLDSVRNLQNYIVGFSIVQTLAFLYGLEHYLHFLYTSKCWVLLAIFIVTLINLFILYFANRRELKISRSLVGSNDPDIAEALKIINQALWFRLYMIIFINATSAIIFYWAASTYTPAITC